MTLNPIQEGGKAITVEPSGKNVAIIVWRKNGGVLLPMALAKDEAKALRDMLDSAISKI